MSHSIAARSIEENVTKTNEIASSLVKTFQNQLSSAQLRSLLLMLIEIVPWCPSIPLTSEFECLFKAILSLSYPKKYTFDHASLVIQYLYKCTIESIKDNMSDDNIEVHTPSWNHDSSVEALNLYCLFLNKLALQLGFLKFIYNIY